MKLYDELYHEIAMKKINVQKKVLRIFELLALPIDENDKRQLVFIYNRIKQVRKEIMKERKKQKLKKR
ncbi:MAG: hypothetical protein WCG98_02430 [bacterium]